MNSIPRDALKRRAGLLACTCLLLASVPGRAEPGAREERLWSRAARTRSLARAVPTGPSLRLETLGWRAASPALGAFAAAWDERGLALEGPEDQVRIDLIAVGRSVGASRRLGPALLRPEGARRLAATRGALVERWDLRADGLEHSLFLEARPDGEGALVAELGISGARVSVVPSGLGARLRTRAGKELRYQGLAVFDASGASVPAHMEATPAGLRLIVDDRAARYPLTIDPLLTGAYLEGAKAWSEAGTSVASAGDVNGDGFEDVIVGAPYYQPMTFGPDRGRVLVFLGSAAGVSTVPARTLVGTQDRARFGTVVAGLGDVNGDGFDDVAVGAPFFDGPLVDSGQVLVFLGSASGIGSVPAVTFSGDEAGALLGAVAAAGDVDRDGFADVLVAAPNHNGGGKAYLYRGSRSGLSTSAAWSAQETASGASFGFSLAGAGDVDGDGYGDVIVGAYGMAVGGADSGRAVLFRGTATGLAASPGWTVDGQTGALLGASVAGAGDVDGDGYRDVLVAAPADARVAAGAGRVELYRGSPSGPVGPAWFLNGAGAGEWLGTQVASAGDVNGDGFSDVVVGAYRRDQGALVDAGAALLFYGSPAGLSAAAAWQVGGGAASDGLGMSVASAGDTDGDGLADVVVGVPFYESEEMDADEGAAVVFPGCIDRNRDGVCGDPVVTLPDAGVTGPPDAAPSPDAEAVVADAASVPNDAGPRDAGAAGDAAKAVVDASAPSVDDAGGLDGSAQGGTSDAGVLTDGGEPDAVGHEGCGCSGTGAAPSSLGLLALLVASGVGPRRRARRSGPDSLHRGRGR